MRTLANERQIRDFLGLLRQRAQGVSSEIEQSVRDILAQVRERGDAAVREYTQRFDRHALPVRVSASEIRRISRKADPAVRTALEVSAGRIYDFHSRQRETSWSFSRGGIRLGQIIRPLARAGVYVPGGKASYPSTVLMNVIPAQVAGVMEIAVCVPTPNGEVNPAIMAALELLGITEVYRIGGAQAVGAMAYGTKSIGKVDKIVGPGNIYVALAKKMVFGEVDIDMIAGPSEILIIADDTANPAFVAADMLSQAEHDEMASSILVTTSPNVAKTVREEMEKQLAALTRTVIARTSLDTYGAIIQVKTMDRAIALANEIAPEHLEIMTRQPEAILAGISNAGAAFLGPWTPEPIGDYSAGPNHTLPTGGTARFSSPLGTYDFLKRTSLLQFTEQGFAKLAGTVETMADSEGLEAHGNTIRIRKEQLLKRTRNRGPR